MAQLFGSHIPDEISLRVQSEGSRSLEKFPFRNLRTPLLSQASRQRGIINWPDTVKAFEAVADRDAKYALCLFSDETWGEVLIPSFFHSFNVGFQLN